jgi:uncharacterized protein YbaR (Trm112 family)
MDSKLIDLLACPVCKGPLVLSRPTSELVCRADRLGYPIRDDLPIMLEDEARRIPLDDAALAR